MVTTNAESFHSAILVTDTPASYGEITPVCQAPARARKRLAGRDFAISGALLTPQNTSEMLILAYIKAR